MSTSSSVRSASIPPAYGRASPAAPWRRRARVRAAVTQWSATHRKGESSMRLRMSIVSAALLGALAVAGTAQAANWPVALGEQDRPPAGTQKGATLNQFMPSRLVVAAGDTVTF